MGLIADGTYEQVGTFNGNPLSMAAARATLLEALTPEAYARIERLRARMHERRDPGAARPRPPVAGRDRRAPRAASASSTGRCATCATSTTSTSGSGHLHWLVQHNGGVFLPPWGKVEQWLLSVQHDEDGRRPVRAPTSATFAAPGEG